MESHPHVKPVFRKDVNSTPVDARITMPYFTKYELVNILGVRTQQLSEGARPLVSIDGLKTSDPRFLERVAMREIEQRKLPMLVRRHMPDKSAEDWSLQELETMW